MASPRSPALPAPTRIDLGIVRDRRDEMSARIGEALDARADIIVTLGGASVGDHDLVHEVLTAKGMQLDFWKIAMRPGKPLMFGRLGGDAGASACPAIRSPAWSARTCS